MFAGRTESVTMRSMAPGDSARWCDRNLDRLPAASSPALRCSAARARPPPLTSRPAVRLRRVVSLAERDILVRVEFIALGSTSRDKPLLLKEHEARPLAVLPLACSAPSLPLPGGDKRSRSDPSSCGACWRWRAGSDAAALLRGSVQVVIGDNTVEDNGTYNGTFTAKEAGSIRVTFDNGTSWMTAKHVFFSSGIVSDREAEASALAASAQEAD